MPALIFYPFACLAVVGALGVVFLKRPTRAVLSLIVTMFALAVLFLQLRAPFVAMVHLVVYAGAVLVLFLFVIMLLGIGAKEPNILEEVGAHGRAPLLFLGLAFFVPSSFVAILLFLALQLAKNPVIGKEGTIERFGKVLFAHYFVPFELVTFLILIGVFATISLVGQKTPEKQGD
jgi:NADH-quinone oxidoreductase subunit J